MLVIIGKPLLSTFTWILMCRVSFDIFLHHFVLAKLATISIRVKMFHALLTGICKDDLHKLISNLFCSFVGGKQRELERDHWVDGCRWDPLRYRGRTTYRFLYQLKSSTNKISNTINKLQLRTNVKSNGENICIFVDNRVLFVLLYVTNKIGNFKYSQTIVWFYIDMCTSYSYFRFQQKHICRQPLPYIWGSITFQAPVQLCKISLF